MSYPIGFAICAVVMTLFPSIAVKINGWVNSTIDWAVNKWGSPRIVAALAMHRGLQAQKKRAASGFLPVAVLTNNNQPGRLNHVEATCDPPTIPVGTVLYREAQPWDARP